MTGPAEARQHFDEIHQFIGDTLGEEAQKRYKIIINDPAAVAREVKAGIEEVLQFRRKTSDAYYFNWLLAIEHEFQKPFEPTHENMANLALTKAQDVHQLAANPRHPRFNR